MKKSQAFSEKPGRLPKKDSEDLADSILSGEHQNLPVNIIFTGDERLHQLNLQFRKKDRPTDVLAFPADSALGILGEVYVSVDTARVQAGEYGAALKEEILRLVCHGVLHLCGYDHHDKTDAERMRSREKFYLEKPT